MNLHPPFSQGPGAALSCMAGLALRRKPSPWPVVKIRFYFPLDSTAKLVIAFGMEIELPVGSRQNDLWYRTLYYIVQNWIMDVKKWTYGHRTTLSKTALWTSKIYLWTLSCIIVKNTVLFD